MLYIIIVGRVYVGASSDTMSLCIIAGIPKKDTSTPSWYIQEAECQPDANNDIQFLERKGYGELVKVDKISFIQICIHECGFSE